MCRRVCDDRGFTLAELMVVVALLGFVLAAAWAVYNLARQGSDQAINDAWLSREIGQPLEYAERIYMQQLDISFTDSMNVVRDPRWWCKATTDRDHDDLLETYIFEATAAGTVLVTSSEASDSPTPRVATWSESNVNQTLSTPVAMFQYYEADGDEIPWTNRDQIRQYAASMRITILASRDGELVRDSRRVYFRNQ